LGGCFGGDDENEDGRAKGTTQGEGPGGVGIVNPS